MKQKLSITIEEKMVELLEKMVEDGTFRNKSHAIEFSLNKILNNNKLNNNFISKKTNKII